MSAFAEFMTSQIAEAQRKAREPKPTILPEAAIARLREAAANYAEQLQGPRFKVGDIVQSPADADVNFQGPCLVIEVRRNAEPQFLDGKMSCSNANGRRLDTRILTLRGNDHLTTMWAESYALSLYIDPDTGEQP